MNYTNVKCLFRCSSWFVLSFALSFSTSLPAQEVPSNLLQAMQWRLIGPHRAGRVSAVAGVPSQPSVYYIGTPGGGVWKTEDAGQVWKPIFDKQHVASIGAIAVAPSDPNILYVGTGEQTQGDGVYKSADAGATWTNVGLHDSHFITGVVIDPQNPDVVIVGVLGDHWTGEQRGAFKTTDGGKNWQKVLFKDAATGVANLDVDPDNPRTFYAALWHRTEGPPNPNEKKSTEQNAAIYKS